MQVCFFCGSANGPDAKVCHSCSQPLAGAEEQISDDTEDVLAEELSECPFCGQTVEPTDEVCGNCHSAMVSSDPLDRPAPKTHERDITARYDEFAGRVQMVRDGRMSRSQFSTWLSTMQQMLTGQRERYVEMIQTSGYYDFSSDEVDMGLTGIFDYEEAMEMMFLFSNTEEADISVLDSALRKMWDGNEKCNEAMRINREFRAKLEDDWGYM